MKQRRFFTALCLGLLSCLLFSSTTARAQSAPPATQPRSDWAMIHNDFFWTDQNGARILTRSGCLCEFNGVFYWYGGNPRGFREQYCIHPPIWCTGRTKG